MAQMLQNKSSSKINHTTPQQQKPRNLGKAPDDIYDLEKQIASIQLENSNASNVNTEECKENEQNSHEQEEQTTIGPEEHMQNETDDECETFTTSSLSEAKQALENGSKIKVSLPENITPHALIGMSAAMGFETSKLQKLFESSSVVVKNLLDEYVQNLQSKYSSFSGMQHPYQSSAFGGYLFHCKRVEALQVDNDLSAKIRISMDLDYTQTVSNDDLFATKFKYELAQKVFRCPTQHIRIQDVRAGSVIVVITGISLIALATLGVIGLSIRLHQKRQLAMLQRQQRQQQQQYQQPFMANGNKKKQKFPANSPPTHVRSKSVQQSNVNRYTEIKRGKSVDQAEQRQAAVAPPPQQSSFMTSMFSKIKSGINSFNETYAERTTPGGNDMNAQQMKQQLVSMGFTASLSERAVQKYPTDINQAINWIMQQDQKAEKDDSKHTLDGDEKQDDFVVVDDEDKASADKSRSMASPKPSLFSSFMRSPSSQDDSNYVPANDNKENLVLNINDLLWVNKKNQLWSATVIALGRDYVTVEYDNGGPYLWRKKEQFALNDPCLVQREPGMSSEIEGCVQISKANGGYIKAWKTGLQRPMADI